VNIKVYCGDPTSVKLIGYIFLFFIGLNAKKTIITIKGTKKNTNVKIKLSKIKSIPF
jgi:hypothetical protein